MKTAEEISVQALIDKGIPEITARTIARKVHLYEVVERLCAKRGTALRDLVTRCDGAEGMRADGSNIDTTAAHAALGDFDKTEEA
jgi:hypothetical protein